MDRHIPTFCRNLFQDFCDPKVRERYAVKVRKPGGPYSSMPTGKELEEYEKICMECRYRELEISEPRCIMCQNNQLEFLGFAGAEYVYRCKFCGEKLFATRDILKKESQR